MVHGCGVYVLPVTRRTLSCMHYDCCCCCARLKGVFSSSAASSSSSSSVDNKNAVRPPVRPSSMKTKLSDGTSHDWRKTAVTTDPDNKAIDLFRPRRLSEKSDAPFAYSPNSWRCRLGNLGHLRLIIRLVTFFFMSALAVVVQDLVGCFFGTTIAESKLIVASC